MISITKIQQRFMIAAGISKLDFTRNPSYDQ
jgi:hypothetical protein